MPVLAAVAAVFGAVIGSFLNVVVWRLPRGESLAHPPSHCPACGSPVRPRDNVPVLSWLLLRGRCRDCGVRISVRYPAVELLTAGLFAGMAVRFGWQPALPAFLYLVAVGVALAFIDLDTKRLPNALTLPSYGVGAALLGIAAAADGSAGPFLRALAGMGALLALYLLLVVVYPAGMGLGDLKLSGVLGLYLGWVGWGSLVVGAFLGFLLGGVVGIALLARGAGRKARIPFGPFMITGAVVAVFCGQAIAHAYLHGTMG